MFLILHPCPPSSLCRSFKTMWDSPGGGRLSWGEQKSPCGCKASGDCGDTIAQHRSFIKPLRPNVARCADNIRGGLKCFIQVVFDDVKHFHFLLAFKCVSNTERKEGNIKCSKLLELALGKEAQMAKPLFNSWLTPWKSFSWSPPQRSWGSSLHVFRPYQEVGGSPPVQCVASLVEVLALL